MYENCPCNSGKKYKFCCMNKEMGLDIYKWDTPILHVNHFLFRLYSLLFILDSSKIYFVCGQNSHHG
ncbi:SEC-C metal-binding domain-containing protein [Bacillus cereus]|uniref:SEC-C metal-binding domain-containing protein n=1 Tax=Bacillus cereus TaxID=1396 RepID=UPI001E3E0F9B|nr:SEC-C metal-binding domain-containing protein [Bacillus cereus]